MLKSKDIEDYYIVLYFGNDESYEMLAIKRAYRDFSRTLRNFNYTKQKKTELKNEWHKVLQKMISEVVSTKFDSQNNFDNWHKKKVGELQKATTYKLKVGHVQKWINMTLKYAFVLGDKRIAGITMNYKYFHVPIDNIIQEEFSTKLGVPKLSDSWSNIEKYSVYMDYQHAIRARIYPDNAFETEFKLFNRGE